MKYGWKHYWAPTPVKIRKLADSVSTACVFTGALSSLNGEPKVGTGIFIVGFLSKVLSNFFRNDYKKVKKG